VTDVRFRRALLRAIDRQAMVDSIQAGLVPVAHNYVNPAEPEYKYVADRAVRYDYDPIRASQEIEALGYTKGADGRFRDASGEKLSMEVRATASLDIHTKSFFPVVDYWQQVGVTIDPVVIPIQRLSDLEYRSTQPTFEVMRHPNGAASVDKLRSIEAPLPERNWSGRNRSRYMNPAFDAMIERYLSTVSMPERMDALGQITQHISEELNVMGLFYDMKSFLVSNKITNVSANRATWNIADWDAS
jgi:peptide/nickel transport system substrate-binding protein